MVKHDYNVEDTIIFILNVFLNQIESVEMSSKQEKLAAARMKLKEFQGKNKEAVILKDKHSVSAASRDSPYPSNESSLCCTPIINDYRNVNYSQQKNLPAYSDEAKTYRKPSDAFSNKSISPEMWLEGNQCSFYGFNNENAETMDEQTENETGGNILLVSDSQDSKNCLNKSGTEPVQSRTHGTKNGCQNNSDSYCSNEIMKSLASLEESYSNSEYTNPTWNEPKEFLLNLKTSSALNDIIKPLQMELHNHAQTINILVQQRNDAQNALAQTQNLLTEKSGELDKLKEQISSLVSSLNHANERFLQAEDLIIKLNLEKEENLKISQETKLCFDSLKAQFETKEEECSELRTKLEEKDKESQNLLFSLHKAQSQLSLCQIQMQQFSSEEHSALTVKVFELQNENENMKRKIADLEGRLEAETAEKEQSSQNFHIYAQQCNSQLAILNSQVKNLGAENEILKEENGSLSKNVHDLESTKDNEGFSNRFKTELADLHSQIFALTEGNNHLKEYLEQKEEQLKILRKDCEEKEMTLKNTERFLKEVEEENRKLIGEAETPRANERLLATMESDKVAAAKAVSQNQKLKEQIVELEKAFIKLSEEKLELTDQLAHEKHVNVELRKLHEHHDHADSDECTERKSEPLVNDSNEIRELRNIVRQLQDDKVELKARLNSLMSTRSDSEKENLKTETCRHDVEEGELQCEGTKLLLQQMEEKVRKTMNEVAALDEEKEKLEHLVLQLQGETETIGEYITLYQKQRMLLRQRAQEKDNQLLQLSKDKEELRSKLASLDELVQYLLAEKENVSIQAGVIRTSSASYVPENTAGKIRALINEIGSTTLVSSNSVAFEHCSCCSGRLITI